MHLADFTKGSVDGIFFFFFFSAATQIIQTETSDCLAFAVVYSNSFWFHCF